MAGQSDCIDNQFRLQFFYPPDSEYAADVGYEIVAIGPFRLSGPHGEEHTLDPEGPRAALAPALNLFGGVVDEATVTQDGQLTILFSEGERLSVSATGPYEPWTLSGPDGLLVVCPANSTKPAVWFRDEL